MIAQNIYSQLIENPNVHIKDKLFNIHYPIFSKLIVYK